jgi:DNA-binding transcriptional LysR family regulator
LVERSTRRLSLTAEGQLYYQRCRHLLVAVREERERMGREFDGATDQSKC